MEISTALTLELGSLHQPVVTNYQLGVTLFQLYQAKTYQGQPLIRLEKDVPASSDLKRVTDRLLENGVLQPYKGFSGSVFTLLGKQLTAPEVACVVDPFAYLSHLSAMEYHGLTQRMPSMLFLSSPSTAEWQQFALARMKRDLGEESLETYRNAGLPVLTRPRFDKIERQIVKVYTSSHLGAFVAVRDRTLRVATIGRTFLDMIREPDLCGGIYHVLEVFEAHAATYLRLITDEIEQHGTKIDKVRGGYILDERCGLKNVTLDRWQAEVQRGGSRKLYAKGEYSSRFSERWSLSLNIEE
jgi:predicted transcriptional regulator of viral defense system